MSGTKTSDMSETKTSDMLRKKRVYGRGLPVYMFVAQVLPLKEVPEMVRNRAV